MMSQNKFSLARGMGGNKPRLEELKLAAVKTAYENNVVTEVHYVLECDATPVLPLTPELVAALEWAMGHVSSNLPTYHPYVLALRAAINAAKEAKE